MLTRWLICIDDTDNEESIGTGKLARWLAIDLVERGLIEPEHSVTRHQLLVHPDIPYTSHNSSACIEGWGGDDGDALCSAAREFLERHRHDGANPGLCVVQADAVPPTLVEIARAAQRVVLKLEEFDRAVRGMRLRTWSSGETGQGRIGACSGAALRSTGEDGRFIGLRGIRDLVGRASVDQICARSAIEEVRLDGGGALARDVAIETRDWVRPSLIGGRAVLMVRPSAGQLVTFEACGQDDG